VNKRQWLLLSISYTIALTVLSLINIDDISTFGSDYDDKIYHVVAYGMLNLLWYYTLHHIKIERPVFMALVISLIYGIILEVLQGQLTISVGVTIASLFIVIRNKTIVKKL
jgi:hypothetical protein